MEQQNYRPRLIGLIIRGGWPVSPGLPPVRAMPPHGSASPGIRRTDPPESGEALKGMDGLPAKRIEEINRNKN